MQPTIPFLLRQAERDVALSSGRAVKKDGLVRIDIAAANRDPDVFGQDAGDFDPHRQVTISRPFGLSFGGGIHMCIGLELTTGTQSGSPQEGSVGMVVRILRELFAAGLRLDPAQPPELESDASQHNYVSFPVLFTRL